MDRRATFAVCGVPISPLELADAASYISRAAIGQLALQVHLCNAYTLSIAAADERYRSLLAKADLNLADGAPVAWLGRCSGLRRPVRGVELVEAVVKSGGNDLRHYFYGGKEGVAERVAEQLSRMQGALQVAGCETPPYSPVSVELAQALALRVTATRANIVWIGLGTPKQDEMVALLGPLVGIPVIPVGAAFDFLAGEIAPAPRILHGTGVEWVYRLWREPRRLWRRYLIGNVTFVVAVVRERLVPFK